MARCEQCGFELPPKTWFTRYCTKCGAAVPGDMAPNRTVAPPVPPEIANMPLADRVAAAGVTPGFSNRVDTDEFRNAMGKANRTFIIVMIIVGVVLAPLVTFIAWLISPQSAGLMIGACLIVEIIVIIVIVVQLLKRFKGKGWDGEVVEKEVRRERNSGTNTSTKVYVLKCVTDEGKKKTHKERGRHELYDYLKVGDRVRYHPQLTYPLEKYDKTQDAYLVCLFCSTKQNIENDYCGGCGKPLLK